MRMLAVLAAAFLLATPAMAQDTGGISSTDLSRCAGKIGLETRADDAAFVAIMLDGIPWVTIERTEEKVGSQSIATTVTGTGAQRQRRGGTVPFLYTCLIDEKGEAVMFHSTRLRPEAGQLLPPATTIAGSATYREKMALPHGVELRVQLLDMAKDPQGEIVAEQVVRSGWAVPIAFALRAPSDLKPAGRKLVVAARMALGHKTLFQLKQPQAIAAGDLAKPVDLVLEKVGEP